MVSSAPFDPAEIRVLRAIANGVMRPIGINGIEAKIDLSSGRLIISGGELKNEITEINTIITVVQESETFHARITGSAAIGGASYRWRYSWVEVELNGDSFQVKDGGRSGTTSSNYALHTLEDGNLASRVSPGVDPTGTDYAASSMAPQPVSIGSVVNMREFKDVTDATRYAFGDPGNAHDGGC